MKIVLSHHVQVRAAERFPSVTHGQLQMEVADAFQEGRWSGSRPAWLHHVSRYTTPTVYVWTPDRQRTFAVVGETEHWFVKTVMGLQSGDDAVRSAHTQSKEAA